MRNACSPWSELPAVFEGKRNYLLCEKPTSRRPASGTPLGSRNGKVSVGTQVQPVTIWAMLPIVGAVDYDDDSRRRYVVRRYVFDPSRSERRHIVVAVVDSKREYEKLLDRLNDELQLRRGAGEEVDPREHVSGHVMEPGHLARAANGHLVRRAFEHGVWSERLQSLELPSNIAVFHSDEQS